jgi:hypothetical protein
LSETKFPLAWPQGQPRSEHRKRASFHTGSNWSSKRSLTIAEAMGRLHGELGGAAVQDRAFTGFAALPPPKLCWEILAMDPPKPGETHDALVNRIRAAHRAGMVVLPREKNGDVKGAASLNAARDEALKIAATGGR